MMCEGMEMEVSGQLHTPATLSAGPRYPDDMRLDGPQSRSGHCGQKTNILLLSEVFYSVYGICIGSPRRPEHFLSWRVHKAKFRNSSRHFAQTECYNLGLRSFSVENGHINTKC
jgi:hypothetical protein